MLHAQFSEWQYAVIVLIMSEMMLHATTYIHVISVDHVDKHLMFKRCFLIECSGSKKIKYVKYWMS